MKIIKLIVKTKNEKYPVVIGSNITTKLQNILRQNFIYFDKCLIVIDKKISKKKVNFIKGLLNNKKVFTHYFNSNEINKDQKNVDVILKILLKENFSRQDCLIAIGGGITGDVSGFAASIYKRGLQFINIPTTLLSQVDSSIGGKTGINTKHGKNLIGSFYQPKLVLSDTQFLFTLPKREIICGYGEILKHSIIANKNFYNFLNKNINNILSLKSPYIEKTIYESCKIKKKVVEKDEKETGLRKILNFGHTFAHAYEASIGYSHKLNHGEAVLLGMKTALSFSLNENILKRSEYDLILNHIHNFRLPFSIKKYFSPKDLNQILSFMIKDKKNNSEKINLVLLKKIGKPIFNKQYQKKKLRLFLKKILIN